MLNLQQHEQAPNTHHTGEGVVGVLKREVYVLEQLRDRVLELLLVLLHVHLLPEGLKHFGVDLNLRYFLTVALVVG